MQKRAVGHYKRLVRTGWTGLNFLATKVSKSLCELRTKYVQKVTQVSLQHLHLPQAQLHFKSAHCSVHVLDHTILALKLEV